MAVVNNAAEGHRSGILPKQHVKRCIFPMIIYIFRNTLLQSYYYDYSVVARHKTNLAHHPYFANFRGFPIKFWTRAF